MIARLGRLPFIRLLSSLTLTLAALGLCALLVIAGTLFQAQHGYLPGPEPDLRCLGFSGRRLASPAGDAPGRDTALCQPAVRFPVPLALQLASSRADPGSLRPAVAAGRRVPHPAIRPGVTAHSARGSTQQSLAGHPPMGAGCLERAGIRPAGAGRGWSRPAQRSGCLVFSLPAATARPGLLAQLFARARRRRPDQRLPGKAARPRTRPQHSRLPVFPGFTGGSGASFFPLRRQPRTPGTPD